MGFSGLRGARDGRAWVLGCAGVCGTGGHGEAGVFFAGDGVWARAFRACAVLTNCIFRFFLCAVRRRRQECDSSPPQGGGGELRDSKAANIMTEMFSERSLRRTQRCECRCGPPRAEAAARAVLRTAIFTRVSHPAAEAISDEGRPRRRSVKNRKSFDCFKSAAGIRFSVGAVADPEIVSPRRFFGYLLSAQKVTYEKIIEKMRLVRVARAAASRSGGPLLFANAHVAVSAGRGPNTGTSFCFVKYFAMRLDGIVKNSYIC